jgi:hypothetical protein
MPAFGPLSKCYPRPEEKAAISKNIPPEIQELVTGMMLGDGYIRMHGSDAHLQIHQKDKEFVELLWNIFNSIGIVGAAPKLNTHLNKRNGNTTNTISYKFYTFTLPYFTTLFNQWYKVINGKNVKVIPTNISELLSPCAIGYWFAGDGTFHKGKSVIQVATNSFTPFFPSRQLRRSGKKS